jgi:diacylglycerol kinase (ATP)
MPTIQLKGNGMGLPGPEPNPHKGQFGLARPFMAALNSLRGLKFAWREEEAFRQEVAITLPLVMFAILLPVTAAERLLLIFPLGLLLIVELMNTAIEATVDRISMDRHPLSGKAKDLGSAAVGLCIVLAMIHWVVILWPFFRTLSGSR